MPGYLLDSNHVHGIFHQQPSVVKKFRLLPDGTQVRLCVITLGEIEAGHQMTRSGVPERRADYAKHVIAKYHSSALGVSVGTRIYYAQILGRIWQLHPPPSKDVGTEEHLVSLKVDINDVWTAAIAWEHGLVFVTRDRMKRIKEVLKADELKVENWFG